MKKVAREQIAQKKEEIINACEQLYFRRAEPLQSDKPLFGRLRHSRILQTEEILYLEEACVPYPLAGVMAQYKPAAAKKHVWSTGDQKTAKLEEEKTNG